MRTPIRTDRRVATRLLLTALKLCGPALLAFAASTAVVADTATIVIRATQSSGPYAKVIEGLRGQLEAHADLLVTDAKTPLTEVDGLEGLPRLVIALGTAANRRAVTDPAGVPIFSLLMTRQALATLRAGDPDRRFGGMYIEHPLATQIGVAGRVFPQVESYGLLHSEGMPIDATETDVPLVVRPYDFEGNLQLSLRSLLSSVDGLVAIPDPTVFNQNTIHAVLLTAYRLNKPVIGYSRPYVSAGALIAAYSAPHTIGEEGGRLVAGWLRDGRWPGLGYPTRFSIAINRRVASVLGLSPAISPDPQAVFGSVEEVR